SLASDALGKSRFFTSCGSPLRLPSFQERRMGEIGFCQFPPGRAHELPVILNLRCGWDAHDRVIAVRADDRPGLPAQAVTSSPVLASAEPTPKPFPEHGDATVCGPKMLQAVNCDRPLTDLSLVVAGSPLTGLIAIGGELAGGHAVAIRPPLWRDARRLAHVSQ